MGRRAAGPPSPCFLWFAQVAQRHFFPHSSGRGKQWECPGSEAWPSLPSPASSIATVSSNTAAAAARRSARVQPVPGCQPRQGTPSSFQGVTSTRSALQGVGYGGLPLPPLPLGLPIPTAAAAAPREAVPRPHGTQQLLHP